jgi:hypothetical protein
LPFPEKIWKDEKHKRTDGEHVDFWLVEPTTLAYALEARDFGHVVEYVVPHLAFLGIRVLNGGVANGAVGHFEDWKGRHGDGVMV